MFSKFCFSRFLFRGVKGQKIAQMTKNYVCHAWYLGNHTSGSSFAIHKCKMIISPGFFFFQNFDFLDCYQGQRAKSGPNWQKLGPLHFISQEPYFIWYWFMVHMCERTISPGVFYIFSKFWFSGLLEG